VTGSRPTQGVVATSTREEVQTLLPIPEEVEQESDPSPVVTAVTDPEQAGEGEGEPSPLPSILKTGDTSSSGGGSQSGSVSQRLRRLQAGIPQRESRRGTGRSLRSTTCRQRGLHQGE